LSRKCVPPRIQEQWLVLSQWPLQHCEPTAHAWPILAQHLPMEQLWLLQHCESVAQPWPSATQQ
jgi:hypothetical protein